MNKEIKKIVKIAEELDWSVQVYEDDEEILFSKYSPAGQDFNMSIDLYKGDSIEDIASRIYNRYDSYDVSEETYIWLDETGHGVKGAPYDMKDLYEDMEACEEMMLELYDALNKL